MQTFPRPRWTRVRSAAAAWLVVAVATQAGGGRSAVQPLGAPSAETVGAAALALGATEADVLDLRAFYALLGGPAWTDTGGALTATGRDVVALLAGAARHGLDPDAYLSPGIGAAVDLPHGAPERLRRDVAVTLATLRYMHDLHLGRVDPVAAGLRTPGPVRADAPDFPGILAGAVAADTIGSTVEGLAPSRPAYGALVAALARYRVWAGQTLPPLPALTTARPATGPGDAFEDMRALAVRLAAFGDLDAAEATSVSGSYYVEPVVGGVRRFQQRHGLTPDGVLGARTLAALGVSPAARAGQIALALERLRWLPDPGPRRIIAVNVPMFQLQAWEAESLDTAPALTVPVVVGRAVDHDTPLFAATLQHLIFRPFWNVPSSIARAEVLPAAAHDPAYLARQGMEIVRGDGDLPDVVAVTDAALAAVARGTLRIRQRPGPKNALGLVKFVFPNRFDVYMHGTPAQALFARDRRDFSHGCVRVADPAALAAWALTGVPGWTSSRVADAMAGRDNVPVALAAPIDVVLYYLTAMVDPRDGRLHFADDIYGHDAALERALSAAR